MMEQARRREQVPKPEPPPDGYTEIAAPFGGHGLMDLKICFWRFCCLSFTDWQRNMQVRIRFKRWREAFYSISPYSSYVLRGHPDISQGVFRVSYIPAGRFAGDGCVQLVLGAALFSLYRIPPYRGCVSVCSVDRYEVRDDEIRIYGKFVHTGTDVTIQGFNDKGLPVGRFFGEEEENKF